MSIIDSAKTPNYFSLVVLKLFKKCPRPLYSKIDNSTDNLQPYYRIRNELSTSHGCITRCLHTIISTCFRNYLHLSHLEMTRMKVDARRYFWWSLIDKEIKDLVCRYPNCTENSKQSIKASLSPWPILDQP